MRIARDLRVLTVMTGVALWGGASLYAQPPNTGQPPRGQADNNPVEPLPGGSTNTKTGSVGDTMDDAQNRQMDKRFLSQVSQGSLLNVALGKLAAEKSSNDAVKQFGQKMVADHERGIEIVKRVAARDGVPLSPDLDSKHKERLEKLEKLSGPQFDLAYVKDQLKAHQRMVTYFQSEADNGTETAAKKLATNMLPAVQQHLQDVKELNKTLSASASSH
jgi:putative membrane protein